MSSILGTLNSAMQALDAQQGAIETTTANIANSNTEGYSRRRPVFEECAPNSDGTPGGVTLARVEALRDNVLDLRIQTETQQQSADDAIANALQPVQLLFQSGSNSIGDQITNFFNALQSLSTNPSDSSLRQSVLTAASNMASAFQSASAQISQTQQNLDLKVNQDVNSVNELTSQIAGINTQIQTAEAEGHDATDLEDQRSQLLTSLSQVVDFSQFNDSEGVTLTTKDGTPLVIGGRSYALTTSQDAAGHTLIYSGENDITSSIQGGSIGGTLIARDQDLKGLQTSLDTLASDLATGLNTANAQGYDLNGVKGGDIFSFTAGSGAAASLKLAINDPTLIAASSDGSSGGNGNLANLLSVQNQTGSSGETPLNAYSGIVYQIGSQISGAQADSAASGTMLKQLQDQQGSISGVSIDEETTNLLTYQRGYEAAARVITTVSTLLDEAINLGKD
ncbi:MAG TPA: flagellar hook-associated protein FlgK [Candidatus Acidoferrales bacterium]|nr:flagellar hook-associated protein FlgK [Candidatus Acidoferrales bacterium]